MDRVLHDGSDSVQLTSFALNENAYIGTLTILLISAVRTTNVCAVRCAFVRPFKVSLCIKSSRTSGPRTVNRSLLFLAWGYSGIRMLLPESHPCIHSRNSVCGELYGHLLFYLICFPERVYCKKISLPCVRLSGRSRHVIPFELGSPTFILSTNSWRCPFICEYCLNGLPAIVPHGARKVCTYCGIDQALLSSSDRGEAPRS